MPNFIVSYDLNGPSPTHAEIDALIKRVCTAHGRVLESVWYVKWYGTAITLRDFLQAYVGREDRILVAHTDAIAWQNLLVTDDSLKKAFENGN